MQPSPPPIPERFRVARATLWFDGFMNRFIKFGGIAVIVAVFAIFVFIFLQVLPLFGKARIEEVATHDVGGLAVAHLGIDEWAELPLLVTGDGRVLYQDLAGDRGRFEADLGLAPHAGVTAVAYNVQRESLHLGTADGRFAVVSLKYRATFPEGERRVVEPAISASEFYPIGPGLPLAKIDFGDAGARKLAAAVVDAPGGAQLHVTTLAQRRSLMGAGRVQVDRRFDLTSLIEGRPQGIAVPGSADSVVVVKETGEVFYLFLEGDKFVVRQRFTPFADLPDPRVRLMRFLLGEVSLVFVSPTGENRIFSLARDEQAGHRQFVQTKEMPPVPGKVEHFSPSLRNKAYLLSGEGFASLRYATTEDVRWEQSFPFRIRAAVLSGKYERILLLDDVGKLHIYALHDPHPEAGWRAFFGKIWYEGQPAPSFDWQSTGGSDDFEPKLSLVPLIIGSLKGTLYALLFAVPIALLAAIYTSQFLQPEIKRIVKPTMEIMASLPSVVLGFLAALWLAPIVDTRVPSVLLLVLFIPLGAIGFGWLWNLLPPRLRLMIRPGREFVAFIPIIALCGWAAWQLGPLLERIAFVVTDPTTGARVADFRLWWPEFTGASYTQRNSLVVGFVMGFAVIPIIFTISEDALSNVPDALRSGSLALGASRWQTALRIVLPTAAAGIFSALMIGLGRAVGETMIVVMATGNTPVLDLNIFSGMRTLSANIAVELPEAPHHGTLYRTLFLGALVLFLLTFIVNTLAEVLRQRLRERFRTVE